MKSMATLEPLAWVGDIVDGHQGALAYPKNGGGAFNVGLGNVARANDVYKVRIRALGGPSVVSISACRTQFVVAEESLLVNRIYEAN